MAILMLIVALWQLRAVKENYGIKRELGHNVWMWILAILSSFLLPLIGLQVQRLVLVVLINAVAFNAMTWKVIKSYRSERARLAELEKRKLHGTQ